ncbi:OLC1v1007051C4 [Oldenlandia corymbosa var. corymbosa]|uniref:OLC1v1007051C4 n=1 Tax=Oldenlandia corymbosa var. corymbosa TaxID=529605 RepID=A0AAV1DIQ3_OLDCO|nr:OLC1v1007051C4 [Oldenlandia corymbosa var. corymbosa]
MESEGQRTPSTPSAVLASLLYKRANLHEELRNIEKQVYDMETSYLQDPSQCGNVLKGFDGFLTNKNTTLLKRSRKFQPEDRMFSLSSTTSPAVCSHITLALIYLCQFLCYKLFWLCHFSCTIQALTLC